MARPKTPTSNRTAAPPTVLIIEDEPALARSIARLLDGTGADYVVSASVKGIEQALGGRVPCLVLVDVMVRGTERWMRAASLEGLPIVTIPLRLVAARDGDTARLEKEALRIEALREVVVEHCQAAQTDARVPGRSR